MQRIGIKQSNEDLTALVMPSKEEVSVPSQAVEETPLLRRVDSPEVEREQTSTLEDLKVGVDRTATAFNIFGLTSIFATTSAAFPTKFPIINKTSVAVGIPLTAVQLGLKVAADRKIGKSEDINKAVSAAVTTANTYTFSVRLAIASYLAIDAAINNIQENEVDISDAVFYSTFVLITAVASLLHGGLEYYKDKWSHSENKFIKQGGKISVEVLEALYKASNANSFLMIFLGLLGYSESGSINNYMRLGLFGCITMVGIILQIASHYSENSQTNITRGVNVVSASTYAINPFINPTKAEFDFKGLTAIALIFAAVGFVSLLSAKIAPPKKEEASLNIQEEGRVTPSMRRV